MSPLDEIRYINKLAAKKGVKNLSPYQKWVHEGCRGPNPALSRKKRGPCKKTKPPLPVAIENIHEELLDAAFQALTAQNHLHQVVKAIDRIEALLNGRSKRKK